MNKSRKRLRTTTTSWEKENAIVILNVGKNCFPNFDI